MPTEKATDRREADISYAIEELNNNTPVEDVLLEIYNRAINRGDTDVDPFTYTISVLREAYDDLNRELDSAESVTRDPNWLKRTVENFPRLTQLDTMNRLYRGNAPLVNLPANSLGYITQAPDRESGIYRGAILQTSPAVTVQQTGPQTATLHLNSDLATPCQPGQHCTIRYQDGKAQVRSAQEREQPHTKGRERE